MLEVINLLQTTYLDPGTVSVRVAFVLRSTEIFPVLLRFVLPEFTTKLRISEKAKWV